MSYTFPDVALEKKPLSKRRWTLQFSIRGLLVATAIVAMILGALVVPELFAIAACAALLLITAILVTTAFCGRGWIRPFAIAALVPNLLTYLAMIEGLRSPEGVLIVFAISIVVSLVSGTLAAVTHGYLRRREGKVAVPDLPFIRDWFSNQ